MKENKITSPSELRTVLLAAIEAVCEGRMTVQQANSVANLSSEIHKSIRMQWDMKCYAANNMRLEHGEVVKMLEI